LTSPILPSLRRPVLLALALALVSSAFAAGRLARTVAPAGARDAIELFLKQQTAGLPGRVEITLQPAALGDLPACADPQAFLPAGARAWGRVSVGVRCDAQQPWTRYIPAYVAVMADYQVAARPIETGQALAHADAATREGDLSALPASVVTDPSELQGMVAANRISAGAPLRREMLRGALVIRQGQDVRLVMRGPGFVVGTEGKAMANASAGATVQVKTREGRLLSGVAQADGSVERAN
jgi:flagella basal body P-ring formation protein FlgA